MRNSAIKTLWEAVIGKFGANDTESFKQEFANQIIGNLKSGEFVARYDQLHVWVNRPEFEEALEESKQYLLEKLITQGGSSRRLAERLIVSDGILLHIGEPPAERNAILIKSDSFANGCHIWYVLDKVIHEQKNLILDIDKDTHILIPGKRYTLGRGIKSGNMSEMITIRDDTHSISRIQSELYNERGAWFCKALSSECGTYIQRPEGNLVTPYSSVALKDNYPNENKIEFINDGITISVSYRFESSQQ